MRQPRKPRTIVTVSVPIEPDYTRACRAAGVNGETLAAFIREAMRQRANRVLGKDDQKVPVEAFAAAVPAA